MVQKEIYKMKKKQQDVLQTSNKRYQATDHLNVLNLKNPISWREYKDPSEWLEDFRTERGKVRDFNNMHLLCVSKGNQLEHFIGKTVEFLTNLPATDTS